MSKSHVDFTFIIDSTIFYHLHCYFSSPSITWMLQQLPTWSSWFYLSCLCLFSFLSFFLFFCFFIERERGREGKREGENHQCERETSISCLSYAPCLGTKPATWACAPTRKRTGNLSLCGMTPNQLSHTGEGLCLFSTQQS